jgi:translation initiation factor IF-2
MSDYRGPNSGGFWSSVGRNLYRLTVDGAILFLTVAAFVAVYRLIPAGRQTAAPAAPIQTQVAPVAGQQPGVPTEEAEGAKPVGEGVQSQTPKPEAPVAPKESAGAKGPAAQGTGGAPAASVQNGQTQPTAPAAGLGPEPRPQTPTSSKPEALAQPESGSAAPESQGPPAQSQGPASQGQTQPPPHPTPEPPPAPSAPPVSPKPAAATQPPQVPRAQTGGQSESWSFRPMAPAASDAATNPPASAAPHAGPEPQGAAQPSAPTQAPGATAPQWRPQAPRGYQGQWPGSYGQPYGPQSYPYGDYPGSGASQQPGYPSQGNR